MLWLFHSTFFTPWLESGRVVDGETERTAIPFLRSPQYNRTRIIYSTKLIRCFYMFMMGFNNIICVSILNFVKFEHVQKGFKVSC